MRRGRADQLMVNWRREAMLSPANCTARMLAVWAGRRRLAASDGIKEIVGLISISADSHRH